MALTRPKRGVVQAAEKRFQMPAGGAVVADGGQQRTGARVIDDRASVDRFRDFRRCPLDAVQRVRIEPAEFYGVLERRIEDGSLTGDGVGGGRISVRAQSEGIEGGMSDGRFFERRQRQRGTAATER